MSRTPNCGLALITRSALIGLVAWVADTGLGCAAERTGADRQVRAGPERVQDTDRSDMLDQLQRQLGDMFRNPRLWSETQSGQIRMTGEGKVTVNPDTASLRIGVVTEAPTAVDVADQNAKRMEAVIGALKAVGLGDNAIRTDTAFLHQSYQTVSQGAEPTYRAFNAVIVKIGRLQDKGGVPIARVVKAATDAGANDVTGPVLSLEESATALAGARKAAVEDAMTKAAAYAHALGLRLGRVISVTADDPAPRPSPLTQAAAPPIEAATLDLSVRVTIVWELTDARP